jgi:hypothetical protein
MPKWTDNWWEAPMESSVLSFLKAEWKVSDTGSGLIYLNSCCSVLRFLSSVLLIIACHFGLFILTVLLYVLLFFNLRLLTTHLVSSNCNCITQNVRLYLEFGIPQFYKRVKYVVLQLNKSQIKATVLQLCFYQSTRVRTLKYGCPFCISIYDLLIIVNSISWYESCHTLQYQSY